MQHVNPILDVQSVSKLFGSFTAVDQVSFSIRENEFFTIVGPSGSGKTTLLRMLVGMEFPTSGQILLRGKDITHLPPNKRPTCMVFQSLALFPHMSVGRNIEFPMKIRGIIESERRTRAWELLKLLHLDPKRYYDKNISQCSGGERQRVALARALAYDPEILFFDEPLSAIDARLRKILQKELKDIQRNTRKTFCYVTHSLEEAMLMSDRLAILKAGKIEQIGSPMEIYANPQNAFVAEFMGEVNLLEIEGTGSTTGLWIHANKEIPINLPAPVPKGQKRKLLIRPESLRFVKGNNNYANRVQVNIINNFLLGSRTQHHILAPNGYILTIESLNNEFINSNNTLVGWNTEDSQLLES